jgi:hypothetical protein
MTTADEVSDRIRLLSDTDMYQRAITFVRETDGIGNIKKKQVAGLMEFSRSWGELRSFITHQRDRDWKGNESYKDFFTSLLRAVDNLRTAVKEKYGLVPSDLTKTESNHITDLYAGLLAREFIQHLAAEMLYNRRNERD